jgi:excisionase family DNA binding protein
MSPEDRLVSKKEAARVLGMSVRSVERLIARGLLRVVRILGAVRIRLSDVRKLMDGGQTI